MSFLLIRGLPGSGKSTLAKRLVGGGWADVYFESDMFFEKDGVYRFDPKLLSDAHAWCLERATHWHNEGWRVVVSNTFTRKWEMEPYLEVDPYAIVIVATGEYQNVHGVSDEKIQQMRERWEW